MSQGGAEKGWCFSVACDAALSDAGKPQELLSVRSKGVLVAVRHPCVTDHCVHCLLASSVAVGSAGKKIQFSLFEELHQTKAHSKIEKRQVVSYHVSFKNENQVLA